MELIGLIKLLKFIRLSTYILIWVLGISTYIYIYTYSNLGDTTYRADEVKKAYRAHKVYWADI